VPTQEELREAAQTVIKISEEIKRRHKHRKLYSLFPDKGPLRRELYKPHIYFLKAGKDYFERCIIAANRVGKSILGGYEIALHATGLYPYWWEGKRFNHPTRLWACGASFQTVRDIGQEILLGPVGSWGTGLIPGDLIKDIRRRAGSIPNSVEQITVKHKTGGLSVIGFKAYEQKRQSFEGTSMHGIWLDEECPMDIYGECIIRAMTVNEDEMGTVFLTFTPLMGLTEVVLKFEPNGAMPEGRAPFIDDPNIIHGVKESKFVINATWDDAPHLTEEQKKNIIEGTPLYLRDARAKGIPQLGAGAIYPILEDDITIEDFEIPPWYRRCFGLDTGWKATAALWGAIDPESDVLYLYSCYKQGHAEPETHVRAVKSRGYWIPGVGDYAGTNQLDGKKVIEEYMALGLNISFPDKHVEAGIFAVWERMVSGRLKIFKSACIPLINEIRIYRRNDKGKVAVEQDDHLCDCMRYIVMTGIFIATIAPFEDEEYFIGQQSMRSSIGRMPGPGYFGGIY